MDFNLNDFSARIMRPAFIIEARRLFKELTGVKVTTLVWFGGRYRAMPT